MSTLRVSLLQQPLVWQDPPGNRAHFEALLLPLALPVFFGFFVASATINSGNVSVLFDVLAYLPPTAPGFSIEMLPASLDAFEFPGGSEWRKK